MPFEIRDVNKISSIKSNSKALGASIQGNVTLAVKMLESQQLWAGLGCASGVDQWPSTLRALSSISALALGDLDERSQ